MHMRTVTRTRPDQTANSTGHIDQIARIEHSCVSGTQSQRTTMAAVTDPNHLQTSVTSEPTHTIGAQ